MEVSEDSLFQSVKEIIAQSREKVFVETLSQPLSWTHYRLLLRQENNENTSIRDFVNQRIKFSDGILIKEEKINIPIDYYKYIYKIKSNTENNHNSK